MKKIVNPKKPQTSLNNSRDRQSEMSQRKVTDSSGVVESSVREVTVSLVVLGFLAIIIIAALRIPDDKLLDIAWHALNLLSAVIVALYGSKKIIVVGSQCARRSKDVQQLLDDDKVV